MPLRNLAPIADTSGPVWQAIVDPRLQGRLLSVACRIAPSSADAEDAVQDAMVQALSHADRFRADSRVSTWLHRIAVNAALMGRRRTAAWSRASGRASASGARGLEGDGPGRRGTEDAAPLRELADESPSAELQLVAREEHLRLRLAISRLPPRSRRTIEAFLGEQKDHAVTPSAFRTRLSRTRSRLKELIERLDVGLPETA